MGNFGIVNFKIPPTESDGAIRTEEDVASLEVSVDAAFGVEALQCLEHLVSDAANLWLWQTVIQIWMEGNIMPTMYLYTWSSLVCKLWLILLLYSICRGLLQDAVVSIVVVVNIQRWFPTNKYNPGIWQLTRHRSSMQQSWSIPTLSSPAIMSSTAPPAQNSINICTKSRARVGTDLSLHFQYLDIIIYRDRKYTIEGQEIILVLEARWNSHWGMVTYWRSNTQGSCYIYLISKALKKLNLAWLNM